MCKITLLLPDESLQSLASNPEQAGEELRMLAAVKLYELNRPSARAAARPAGLPKPVFLQRLGEYGVATFRQTAEELEEESRNA